MQNAEIKINEMKRFEGKNVLVVGLARSGIGAVNLLSSLGAKVCVTDIRPREFLEDDIRKLPSSVRIIAGGHPEDLFSSADLVVVSPGIPLNIPPVLQAKANGIEIIGELELAYQVTNSVSEAERPLPRFIGVTGTNGKSTTCTLIDRMLRAADYGTILGGNIGNALTEEVYGSKLSKADYIIAEVSSFQLETIRDFRPHVAVILNITRDHLDRYGSMREYINAKARIFENQGPDDYLILNADDPEIMKICDEKAKTGAELPTLLFFSRKKEVEGMYLKDSSIHCSLLSTSRTVPLACFDEKAGGTVSSPQMVAEVDEMKIRGVHNFENAMAASLAAIISGCPVKTVREVLIEFPGLEHRLEFVREINGVRYMNDSKGTNTGAVARSLESFENVVLIMGGREKDSDFKELRSLIKKKVRALVLIGEAKDKISVAVGDVTETIMADTLKKAVEVASAKAGPGNTVLLSPGCASFDMFADFEERGRKFKEAVMDL